MHGTSDGRNDLGYDREDVLQVLGSRIRALRQAQRRSQAEVARDARMHQSEWSRIEAGLVEPGLFALLGLQRALGVDTLESLLGDLPSQRVGCAGDTDTV